MTYEQLAILMLGGAPKAHEVSSQSGRWVGYRPSLYKKTEQIRGAWITFLGRALWYIDLA